MLTTSSKSNNASIRLIAIVSCKLALQEGAFQAKCTETEIRNTEAEKEKVQRYN
jgi:hypothetical protein